VAVTDHPRRKLVPVKPASRCFVAVSVWEAQTSLSGFYLLKIQLSAIRYRDLRTGR